MAATDRLSPKMENALRAVFTAQPDSIHEEDREPFRWVRMETKPTVDALVRRGLVECRYGDWPDGYKGRLTVEGLAKRKELRTARVEINRAIRRLALGR